MLFKGPSISNTLLKGYVPIYIPVWYRRKIVACHFEEGTFAFSDEDLAKIVGQTCWQVVTKNPFVGCKQIKGKLEGGTVSN